MMSKAQMGTERHDQIQDFVRVLSINPKALIKHPNTKTSFSRVPTMFIINGAKGSKHIPRRSHNAPPAPCPSMILTPTKKNPPQYSTNSNKNMPSGPAMILFVTDHIKAKIVGCQSE